MKLIHSLRGRLTAIAFVVALVAITVLTVAFNLLLARSLDHDADHRLRTQAAAATTTVVERSSRLTLRESPDDAALDRQVWVYDGRRAIERPAAPASVQRAADALVDFGTGHASISRLHGLPVTEVKIDRSFVSDTQQRSRTYLAAIVAFGRSLGLRVVAEGVEDAETLAILTTLHCDLAQGYLISRPLEAPAMTRWLSGAHAASPAVAAAAHA
jgi:hypothetical protein